MRRLSLRPDEGATHTKITRLRILVRGAVQGVGFRPFVYRLASESGLKGWIRNSTVGVILEVEGSLRGVEAFLFQLEREKPPLAVIQGLETVFLDPAGYTSFDILPSTGGTKQTLILPDIATCPECLQELFDPSNRRYLYPFTNCTHCGPRYSIIEDLPYDRGRTTMRIFEMCPDCREEYENPLDRRFHAQPNACPCCGPHLECWDHMGKVLKTGHEALLYGCQEIRQGKIVAVKGLGGFQLLVDARNEEAVTRLRTRKRREEKPLAVMVPGLQQARKLCVISEKEQRLLQSSEAPIVLLQRHEQEDGLAPSVAPGNPNLGLLLPYTPLHHILMHEIDFPVIATSGNLSDEPICIDEYEALKRLASIADVFLVHNRPICRHVDDSVARVILGREMVLRRARGYAPFPIHLPKAGPVVLATGAQLKNTIALAVEENVFISQHVGDLDTAESYRAFLSAAHDLQRMYETEAEIIACDLHPDYPSTHFAFKTGKAMNQVQHHFAHILACMAENEIEGPVLGVAWDGTGYGPDGTVWGGEFLVVENGNYRRVAHLRPFPLPGGDTAVRQPRRSALGMLYEMEGEKVFSCLQNLLPCSFDNREIQFLKSMLPRTVNSPRTTSAGRLFDAVASLCGLRQICSFEGQAAMELEFAVKEMDDPESAFSFELNPGASGGPAVLDWEPMIRDILFDVQSQVPIGRIASRFHNALVAMIHSVAIQTGHRKVVLSGGCFQNQVLTSRTVCRLRESGFLPYWHQRVPPNDGGIALGQVVAARMRTDTGRASDSGEREQDFT